MTRRPALLQITAAASWTVTAIGTFTGFDDHPGPFDPLDRRIWLCTLGAALIVTWAAAQRHIVARFCKSNQALANAVLTRPVNSPGTGPMLIEVTGPHATVSLPDAPPADLHAARRRQREQRGTRR